ncbi:HNH endonuclease [Bacillus sp. JJ1566]|uniref:HNH endonuclease n=1 Tax=Bacillus sp. JJ1566 TaxID=3122961 RepID=UPI002FFFAB80
MGVFREVGKGIGTVTGGVIGGGVKLAGKAVKSTWVEDVGDGIHLASKVALDSAGQFVDGAVKGVYGAIKKDDEIMKDGFHDLKDSTGRTVKGIGTTIGYTIKNAGTTYQGIKTGDKATAMEGVKNIGKVAAVATLAVGVLDFVDGSDTVEAAELETRNDHLVGETHPETGISFEEKNVELSDGEYTGTFPVFDAFYEVQLPENLYLQSDSVHFSYANTHLYNEIHSNPSLIQELDLSDHDIQMLSQGNTPDGYTWHHNEEAGLLQLVDEEVHQNTGHTGGRELWGGGADYR